ncbi:MAG: peroxidase family protein [Betaproteobacteria bacterium]
MHDRPDYDNPRPDISPPAKRSFLRRWRYPLIGGAALLAVSGIVAVAPGAQASVPFTVEALDGSGNNVNHPTWGQAGLAYARVGTAHYADGISQPVSGPNARMVSNRLFNDKAQNIFSERRLSNFAWTWGQFLDHTFGHRIETGTGADPFNIPFDSTDALEDFHSNLSVIPFNRSPNTPGTGTSTSNPRQQTNQLPSYISANTVYGATNARLDWLRSGPLDGDPTNNSASLMLPGGYLPTADARGDASSAPAMDRDGRLTATPNDAMVAGDVRANENIALTAFHTLFAREHNRIVSLLPSSLSDEDKFQIARRVVIAEEQYITYQEWLPAMGVPLPAYTGYNANVDATLTNEFATVGYRAHTQIHGDGLEVDDQPASRYSSADLANFQANGLDVQDNGDGTVSIDVPLGVMFFNPDLLKSLQLGPVLESLGSDPQYRNDNEIDNQLRSTLFEVPSSSDTTCLNGPTMPNCFNVVQDLGAIDIQRDRDHGDGTLNQIRQAYGLSAYTSFTQLTGESTDALPSGTTINDPSILNVTSLKDIDGKTIAAGDTTSLPMSATRKATVAARLKAIYGNINNVDGFVGIFAEKHVFGTEMGQTQLAIWQKQFQALRDGDRFYFANDQGLSFIKSTYGIDFHHTLAQLIEMNTDVTASLLNPTGNVFFLADSKLPATTCQVTYTISNVTSTTFQGNLAIKNTSSSTINNWQVNFGLYQGQNIQKAISGASFSQSGPNNAVKTATGVFGNSSIAPGATVKASFQASWDGFVNQKPPNINMPARRCAVV